MGFLDLLSNIVNMFGDSDASSKAVEEGFRTYRAKKNIPKEVERTFDKEGNITSEKIIFSMRKKGKWPKE